MGNDAVGKGDAALRLLYRRAIFRYVTFILRAVGVSPPRSSRRFCTYGRPIISGRSGSSGISLVITTSKSLMRGSIGFSGGMDLAKFRVEPASEKSAPNDTNNWFLAARFRSTSSS